MSDEIYRANMRSLMVHHLATHLRENADQIVEDALNDKGDFRKGDEVTLTLKFTVWEGEVK